MLGSKQDSNTQPSYNQQENGYQQSSNTQQNQGYQQQQAPVYEYQNAQGRTVPPPNNNAPEVGITEDDIPF
jgi:single-stranded DNA-binding protein